MKTSSEKLCFSHIFAQNIDCGYALEPPQRGRSTIYVLVWLWFNNKKKCIPLYTPVLLHKSGVYGGIYFMDILTQGCPVGIEGLSCVTRKGVFGVSDQVRHKPACTVSEKDWKLEILDLTRRKIELSI